MSSHPPFTFHTTSATQTHALGQAIGLALVQLANRQPARPWHESFIIALQGNLGAGKTMLTQGLALGLGISDRVTSPTFVFINEYPTAFNKTLIHMDSYRLGEEADAAALEAFTFGLDEILDRADAIVVIEWADRLQELLPPDHLQITLTYGEDRPEAREIQCIAHGPMSEAILATIKDPLLWPNR